MLVIEGQNSKISIWKRGIKSDYKQQELAEWQQLKHSTKLHNTVLREVNLLIIATQKAKIRKKVNALDLANDYE